MWRLGEVGELASDLVSSDGLRYAHQTSHLPVKEAYGPPDFATALHQWLAEILDRHVGMHTVCLPNTHGLAYLQGH
jgi:hypothetical protein